MRPRAAPRSPAGRAAAAATLELCSLLLLLLLRPGHACPAGCACTDPHTVDCRDRGLPSVPDPFPLDVRKLLVAGNRIQHIPEDFFIFYGDLVYLDFRNNSLRSLEEGTFSGSAKLAFLDLSYNNLTQLGAGAFRSAGRLVKLSLANNKLAGVHEDAFETLESLQVLELNDNNLRSLNVAALAALPALRTLRLDGNPWLCDCDFAHLFSWIQDNASKLPKGFILFEIKGPFFFATNPLAQDKVSTKCVLNECVENHWHGAWIFMPRAARKSSAPCPWGTGGYSCMSCPRPASASAGSACRSRTCSSSSSPGWPCPLLPSSPASSWPPWCSVSRDARPTRTRKTRTRMRTTEAPPPFLACRSPGRAPLHEEREEGKGEARRSQPSAGPREAPAPGHAPGVPVATPRPRPRHA
ncbi:leucine-rich repeat-containing protein 38 isoform X1 [Mustela erminea]|uniref:leucine-rich repeat-containing protein 38 isoform X1 n=1 Tax=Mustela erminea TaxID=36723 RepID=UPI001386D5F3|nr:leucine-rich repeat-containing protein 38 isoform X1 [Mustela erminea]